MELATTCTFNAPPDRVWALLMDPEVLAACLPGCERLEPVGDDRYKASLTVAVAAISGQYAGTVAILDKRPPHSYRLEVEGSGRTGFVKGHATIELTAHEQTTVVSLTGQGQVGGLVARVGQRLLGTVSKMMVDRFFACLQKRAETPPDQATPPAS
jgi:carbon monoxide dehydrogenase subunit G